MLEWNQIKYIDCMDEEEGLPSLPNKSIDLGYTDPPWNSGIHKNYAKGRSFHGRILREKPIETLYYDSISLDFLLDVFYELERICNKFVLVVNHKIKKWLYKNTDPTGELIIYFKNSPNSSKISQHNCYSSHIFYGKYKNKLMHNVIPFTIPWGFLKKDKAIIHPCPKGLEIILVILSELKPESLLDPFAGSGSFLKASDILGIKWVGYEINEIYKQDIEYRFSAKTLEEWI